MLRVRGLFVPVRTVALLLSEVFITCIAFYYFTVPSDRLTLAPHSPGLSIQFALVLASLTVLMMVAVGLYNYTTLSDYRAMMPRVLLALALEGPIIFAATFLYGDFVWPAIPAWTVWYLEVVVALFACLVITRVIFLIVGGRRAWKRRVVIFGAGDRAAQIRRLSEAGSGGNFVPAAFIAFGRANTTLEDSAVDLGEMQDSERLYEFAMGCGAREIVIATDDRRGLPVRALLSCKARGIAVTEFLTFCERESGRVDLDALRPSWLIYSDGFRVSWADRAVKRMFDVVVSITMLGLTLPLLLMTAIAIKLEDGGPIFYSQERVGLFGRRFILHKFRSMRQDAEPSGVPQWAAQRDSRVTRVGWFIRKVRIDELPQLINVLKGDMSFIGPRPERPYFVEQLRDDNPFYGERHAVKPGITGWAQISQPYGASLQDARQKLSYDLYYVKNHNLLLDIIILIQTVRVILFGEGAR
jgi:sugar transferase (PEP-CTERM system associated)